MNSLWPVLKPVRSSWQRDGMLSRLKQKKLHSILKEKHASFVEKAGFAQLLQLILLAHLDLALWAQVAERT
jgi:hypothetical protein